jgi:hypothetical protein
MSVAVVVASYCAARVRERERKTTTTTMTTFKRVAAVAVY